VNCGWNREQRRAWKEQRRAWKRAWREGGPAYGPPPPEGPSWGAGAGAAYAGWHAGPRPSRGRVFRSRDDRWLAGVAGGLAEHWGVASWAVRLAFVLAAMMAGPFALFGYMIMAAAMRLPPDADPAAASPRAAAPDAPPRGEARDDGPVRASAADAARRLRELDRRVAAMEAVVLTQEFDLGRKIRALGE
jgi:phage shock protein C